jgi:flagellar L-ring protein precursor FlgH
VKPNGTLVLQGRKKITTDDEYQQFLITGIARAEDVTADNTVLSTQLADFNLRKTHKGAVRNATKKGLIPKLLDVINPF